MIYGKDESTASALSSNKLKQMKFYRTIFNITILLSTMLTTTTLEAQEYKYEGGLSLGATSYMGDHYQSVPFGNPGYSLGAMFRYNRDFRSALKLEANYNTIDAVVRTNKMIDLSAQYEYNFFHFSDICKFKQTEIFTPYLTTGLGLAGVFYENRGKGSALFLPIGFGVKWKASKRINVGAEYSVRWYLSDHLDDNMPGKVEFHLGKGNDWYNLIRLFVTFDFGKRLCDCPIYYYKQRKGY